jgi:Flp pilus assembly protein TadG
VTSGMRRFARDTGGAALLEAALVLPLLLVVTLGMIQFGMLFNEEILVTNAAAAGGRQASVSRGDLSAGTNIQNVVTTTAAGLNTSKMTVYICVPSSSSTCAAASSCGTSCNFTNYQGDQVTVTVKYACTALFNFGTTAWSYLNIGSLCPISTSVTEVVQ